MRDSLYNEVPDEEPSWSLELIDRIRQDSMEKLGYDSANMSREETRFVVTSYYDIQSTRLQLNNRLLALKKKEEPRSAIEFIFNGMKNTEDNIKKILVGYSKGQQIGQWAESIPGIGPVISAGLIAHIDITRAPTVGHIWRFAGLDPTSEWLGREKAEKLISDIVHQRDLKTNVSDEQVAQIANLAYRRADALKTQALSFSKDENTTVVTKGYLIKALSKRPWNADLKLVCWKAGQSFVPLAGKITKEKGPDIYGNVYSERKVLEIQRNEAGNNADVAAKRMLQVGRDTDAYKAYSQGFLPPGHVHARATRYATKLFLAHWHHVAYELKYNTPPPKPYIIEHGGHTHYIAPPHWGGTNIECDCPTR